MAIDGQIRKYENHLRDSPNEWQWKAAQIIATIPRGYLATYGTIAECVNTVYGFNVNARNIAWLRRRLYALLGHNTKVPLHRIAKQGDIDSKADSIKTRKHNDERRRDEGTKRTPKWATAKELCQHF